MATADIGFEKWKQIFRKVALDQGILPKIFDESVAKLTIDPQVITFDGSQPEFTRNIWDYINNAISDSRIKKGRSLLAEHQSLFGEVEKRYGVQREVIAAIWAMESDFGRNYGDKNILRSLATLAYASHSKKRKDFASKELILSLKIIQTQKMESQHLIGSWAGAMGQPQFMPSSYLKYGVDYNRDGQVDLWQTLPDILASIANFLVESGWRLNEHWGEEVKLPKGFDWRLNNASYQLRFSRWKELGLRKVNNHVFDFPQRLASLFIPAGKGGPDL